MPKRKIVELKSIQTLEKLNTRQLLGYLNQLRKCEEAFELSDMDENPDDIENNFVYFKNTEKWKLAYRNVKSVLSRRAHIERKSTIR